MNGLFQKRNVSETVEPQVELLSREQPGEPAEPRVQFTKPLQHDATLTLGI